MNSKDIIKAFESIRRHITENEEYLTKLDRQNGDGDLGKKGSLLYAMRWQVQMSRIWGKF